MDPGILIPVTGYGGHERLVEMFAHEYQALGHDVELLITNGSSAAGAIVHGLGPVGFPPRKRDAIAAIFRAWNFLYKNHQNYDLIHNFGRLIYLLPILNKKVKKIMTYGREITGSNTNILLKIPHQNIVFTGCSQNLISRANATGNWKVVYNAINFEKYIATENLNESAPFIFLGRIERVKGCHTAIAVAKATNNKLIIAGNISNLPEEIEYFEKEIKPFIDGEQIKYAGPVNDTQKNKELGQAKALLFPIEWNEPFGIVMIEAMACGTPVIAFNQGSVEEVIDENITGFKVKNMEGMLAAITKLPMIDRIKCRQQAEARFNVTKTARQYLSLFAASTRGKKVVLVTSAQPAINPRTVKEANTLSNSGYDVTVIYTYKIDWAFEAEKNIIPLANWDGILAGGNPYSQKILYYYTKIRQRIFVYLNEIGLQKFNIAEHTQNRCYTEQLKIAKKLKADIYIGHNLGALPIVVKAAEYGKRKAAFDFEDYHRNEYQVTDVPRRKRIEFLEKKYVSKVSYISFSSPAIKEEVLKDFPRYIGKTLTLLNSFPLEKESNYTCMKTGQLRLLWFSQTVGPNRGLECLFEALLKLQDPNISLTIAGRVREDVIDTYTSLSKQILGPVEFAGVLQPHLLHKLALKHDVGLALEPGFSRNNSIALSNKIFTYVLAGNAVIFSETEAQKEFNDTAKAGLSFPPDDVDALAACIRKYTDIELLQAQKQHNLILARTKYNWELESEKLLEVISEMED